MDRLMDALILFRTKIAEFVGTDFTQVKFESLAWAAGIGASLALLLLLKLLFSRKRTRAHSGHVIPKNFRPSLWIKAVRTAPKIILAAGTALLIFALADPYLPRTKNVEVVESRERVDLVDVSGSMADEFRDTGKSAGEIARNAHLKFLMLRRGKKDRVSLWLFSDNPYKAEDFIVDDDTYFFQVFDAPYSFTPLPDYCLKNSGTTSVAEEDFFSELESFGTTYSRSTIAPCNRIQPVPDEGSTDLAKALAGVIPYFDQESDPHIKRKTLVIFTDAEVDVYPEAELKQLKERKIVPYIVFVDQSDGEGGVSSRAQQLISTISSFGGKYYRATDEKELEEAVRDIDKTEKARIEVEKYASKLYIFQRFLAMGLLLLLLGTLVGLTVELRWTEYP